MKTRLRQRGDSPVQDRPLDSRTKRVILAREGVTLERKASNRRSENPRSINSGIIRGRTGEMAEWLKAAVC
jgi:hypothetical protein